MSVIVAVAVIAFFIHRSGLPANRDLREWLAGQFPEAVEIADFKTTVVKKGEGTALLDVSLTLASTEPLFRRIDTGAFVERQLGIDASASREIAAILSGRGAERIRQLAGFDDQAESLASVSLVEETTPIGATLRLSILVEAELDEDTRNWDFDAHYGQWDDHVEERFVGIPAADFSGRLLRADRAETRDEVRRLAQSASDTLARLREARQRYVAERAAEAASAIRAGAHFSGDISTSYSGGKTGIVLAVGTTDPATSSFEARLYNDGGLSLFRRVSGRHAYHADTDELRIVLNNLDRAISQAGPLLETDGSFTWNAVLDADNLTVSRRQGALALRLLPDADKDRLLERLGAAEQRLRASFAPGNTLRFQSRVLGSKPDGSVAWFPEENLLRISALADDGALEATLESVTHGWRRSLKGRLVTHTHAARGRPLQLEFSATDRTQEAGPTSLFFIRGRRLLFTAGDGAAFESKENDLEIALAPASDAWLGELSRKRAEQEARLTALLKPGAAWEGIARSVRSTSPDERIRLIITKADVKAGTVEAWLDSHDHLGLRRHFRGSINVVQSSLALESTGAGVLSRQGPSRQPWLQYDRTYAFTLGVGDAEFSGRQLDEGWELVFPFTRTPAAALPFDSPPTAPGGHLWSGRSWLPLPTNGAKVHQSIAQTATGGKWSESLGRLFKGDRAAQATIATLRFEGSAPVPAAEGAQVLVAWRGIPAPANGTPRDYPVLEVMRMSTDASSGVRSAPLVRIGQGAAGFGSAREPGTVIQLEPSLHILRFDRPLSPGPHALSAGAEGAVFEFTVSP